MEKIVKTTNLTKAFKSIYAVDNIHLQISKGAIYGFLGPNGAGKTTAIKLLLGLMRPTSGDISIFGKNIKKEKLAILKKVGSLVESPSYYGHLTAVENLEITRRILNVPKSRVDEVLSIVRLEKAANRPVKGYSLGMKQRLGIASSLLGEPELLILDEPTNGLDPSGIIEIRELIKQLPTEYGMTVLVSSHLLSEIDQMATEVGIISKGKLIFQDSIHALRKKSVGRVRIKTNEGEKAWRHLVSKGWKGELVPVANEVIFSEVTNDTVSNIVKSLVEKNFPIYRVEEEKDSLESIFLEMTREEHLL